MLFSELTNFIGAILNHSAVIEFFTEGIVKYEVNPDEYIYIYIYAVDMHIYIYIYIYIHLCSWC